MSRLKPYAKHILAWGLTVPGIIASAFILQLAWIPGQQPLGNDSGFFAYVGRQILAG